MHDETKAPGIEDIDPPVKTPVVSINSDPHTGVTLKALRSRDIEDIPDFGILYTSEGLPVGGLQG